MSKIIPPVVKFENTSWAGQCKVSSYQSDPLILSIYMLIAFLILSMTTSYRHTARSATIAHYHKYVGLDYIGLLRSAIHLNVHVCVFSIDSSMPCTIIASFVIKVQHKGGSLYEGTYPIVTAKHCESKLESADYKI